MPLAGTYKRSINMKNAALTITLLCALGAFAYGGPEPSGKEMKQVAPVPTPCPSWTGFEVGGFGAYVYGVADTHLDLTGTWELFHDTEVELQNRGNRSLGTSGGEIGGFIGYNYQFAGNWVIGAEFDGGYMFLRDSKERQFIDPDFESEFAAEVSIKTNYLLTLGGKIGYAFCHWMPYFTGGGAWANVDFSGRLVEPGTENFLKGGTSDTRTGWFVGGGVEYMLTNHWRLRAQYQYIDLGETGFTRTTPFIQGITEPFISHRSVDMREHNAQFAIIYAF
jgi:outer membrane immunogenic protein